MIEITTISNGEKAEQLADEIINLINKKYSNCLTGYELIGVLDTVKQLTHLTCFNSEDDE